MKPTKKQLKEFLKESIRLKKEDDKLDEMLKKLFNFLSPNFYPPFIETTRVSIFCDALELLFPNQNISDSISYFIYEVPGMAHKGPVDCVDKNGKHYDARNINEYIEFITNI